MESRIDKKNSSVTITLLQIHLLNQIWLGKHKTEKKMAQFAWLFRKMVIDSSTLMEQRTSTISYGFRTIHKDSTSFKNLHSCITKPQDYIRQSANCQIYPMAFMHPGICPFLYHHEEGSDIVRTQTYQEPWSAHKNIHPKQARKIVGQNLNKAIDKNVLNLSALRSGFPHLAVSLDASFKNWRDTNGTRFEVAVRPKFSRHSSKTSVFDLHANLITVWQ